jgi:argininosuccinate lyase
MPQKKNPVALEHAKAAAGAVQGALLAALAATKNTAFADVNDAVTSVNEQVLDAATRTRRILALLEEVFAHLTLRPARMAQAAAEGFGTATELADVMVREAGLSFRMAHHVVALVVRNALAAGKSADAITTTDLDTAAAALFGKPLGIAPEAVAQALDPAENIRTRTVLGGPAPASMARMLAARDAALGRDAAALEAAAGRIRAARDHCFGLARAMAAP